jgi:hypothetical protein
MNRRQLSKKSVVVAASDQISSTLEDEVVILNLADSVYYGLNPVGAHIWTLIQQPRTIEEVVSMLLDEYEVERSQCLADVSALIQQMVDRQLVKIVDEPPA